MFVAGRYLSKALDGRIERYVVILPPGYDPAGSRRYPVLYWLHDAFGDSRSLLSRGIAGKLREEMRAGRVAPFVIACPEGEDYWFTNSFDGELRYADLVSDEFRHFVEERFLVRTDRAGRAISGISMGGFGALHAAQRHPELYGSVSILSGTVMKIGPEVIEGVPWFIRTHARRAFGSGPRENNLRDNDPYTLFDRDPTLAKRLPPVLIHCGTDDDYHLDAPAQLLADRLRKDGASVELVLGPGDHEWDYWGEVFPHLVSFHSRYWTTENKGTR